MTEVTRIALLGYNPKTDTNLDHYSLFTDEDNVLIKRLLTDTATITDGNPTILTVDHDLNYIPLCLSYYYDEAYDVWALLNNKYNPFSVPPVLGAIDTSSLYIHNYGGNASGHLHVAYDIFYDNMNDTTAPSIVESNAVYKVARPGKSRDSKNPNDYIMHSDLNNFKILKQGTADITIASGGLFSPTTYAHGADINTPVKYLCWVKFPDGKCTLLGDGDAISYDESKGILLAKADTTYLYFYNFGDSIDVSISYIIYGTGKDGTIPINDRIIACADSGINPKTETNPDKFKFHSLYPTLKYDVSDSYSMTVSETTVHTIAHGLGYTPVVIPFVNDIAGVITNGYSLAPYYWGRSTFFSPSNDIAAFVYVDDTYIYLKAYYQANAVGTSKTFNFYYKIFKNNLGI